jgi:phospholipid transport system substrate-binding protein
MRSKTKNRLLIAVFCLLSPGLSWGGPPMQQVRSTVEGIQTVMLDARQQPDAKKKQRVAQIRHLIARRFDFTEMAKRALGPEWQRRSQRERGEYVKLFTDLVETSYLDRMETYAGEHVVYLRENRDADYAEVATKALAVKDEDLAINYKLKRAGSEWKIYDLIIDNVSVVNNYRAQFTRILNETSFDRLLSKLRESRQNQMQAKKSRPDTTLLSAWILAQASPNRPR